MTATTAARQTIHKYARGGYPHPAEDGVRPLSMEVPYLYADGSPVHLGDRLGQRRLAQRPVGA